MTARCSTSAACNASYTFRGTTPVSIVVYSFFFYTKFPFRFLQVTWVVCVCDLAPPDGAYPLNIFSVAGPGETTSFKAHQRGRAIPGDGNPRAQELRHSAASRFDSEYILV